MRLLPITLAALLASCAATSTTPEPAAVDFVDASPTAQHTWLQQLVGTWDVTSVAEMGEGVPPIEGKGTETVRGLGGLWIVAEGVGQMDTMPMTSVMTLGYDPERGRFIGTWVDSTQTKMWTYTGTLDAARTTLTLEAEGPDFFEPTRTALFHDVILLEGPARKVLTSSIQGADGTWTSFMRATYTRRK